MRLRTGTRRPGFSLIELLVVVIIIAVLLALTAGAVLRFRDTGPVSATRTNFTKINSYLLKQWGEVRDAADRDSNRDTAYLARALLKGGTAANPEVKKEYVRLKLLQAFPRTFAEALDPAPMANQTPLPPWPAYKSYLNGLGITTGNEGVPDPVQRAICLLMILQRGPKQPRLESDDLATTCVENLSLNPVSGTAEGIVDGYRQPAVFTHSFNNQFGSLAILSAGRDKAFGVDANSFAVTNLQQASDNVQVP